ncbi:hypothetical protein LDENG_00090520 [Lucifuga dentata]|nr:hypothetical protein LDENG_00090520 [Lucifuga dentata]
MLPLVLPLLVCLGTAVLPVLQQTDRRTGQQEEDFYDLPCSKVHHEKPFCSWKCLIFTLQWPGAFCVALDSQSLCRVPPSVHNWTIHGLWPVRAFSCCACWPMFHSDVQELEAELTEQWPSLLKTRSNFHFWKEEWEKHGVCAACVEGFNSPLRYFQVCLKLRGQFDIHKVLKDAGISPSCQQPYKLAQLHSVLAPVFGDKLEIQCVTDDEQREVWFQLKIRLSQNLTVGCDHLQEDGGAAAELGPAWSFSPGHPCLDQVPLYYFPINQQQPHRPCN